VFQQNFDYLLRGFDGDFTAPLLVRGALNSAGIDGDVIFVKKVAVVAFFVVAAAVALISSAAVEDTSVVIPVLAFFLVTTDVGDTAQIVFV